MKPQDIDTIVRMLRGEASEISSKDYARIMMREAATTIVALVSELAARDEQARTARADAEHRERDRVLALAGQMLRDCAGLYGTIIRRLEALIEDIKCGARTY
jgi:adenylylsulfate kinase-like enzyme